MRLSLHLLARSWALLAMALGASACSSSGATHAGARGMAEMQAATPDDFTFAVPPGTRFVWTERRAFDVKLAGTPVAERDESELRWDVTARPSDFGTTIFDELLVAAKVTRDGATVVDGTPAAALLQVVVDSGANIQDIRGLEGVSRSLLALAPAAKEGRAARLFSPRDLRALVVTRHDLFLGDVVFRPAREGATWIVPPRSQGDALLRRYTVQRLEPCDGTACAQLRLFVALDPRSIEGIARAIVERHLAAQGGEDSTRGDGARLSVRQAHYRIEGTALIEPATMLAHGALLTESGRALVDGPDGRPYEVDVRGRTEDSYDYARPAPAVAQR
jgi:hypothetical protein